jgi:hypothetical protein
MINTIMLVVMAVMIVRDILVRRLGSPPTALDLTRPSALISCPLAPAGQKPLNPANPLSEVRHATPPDFDRFAV